MGGVGSGKTRAGCIQAFAMPPGSFGAIIAPTYPMLRDATLRTFLELAREYGILRKYNKADNVAVLGGDRTILFRSADNPDRLRGPNLGWFLLDEAAMMPEDVWKIMIGRLRLSPGLAWCMTTPRGKNWVWHKFAGPTAGSDYSCTRASSRTNPFLPSEFVPSLVDSYDPTFASQEIDGEFIDDVVATLIPEWWIDRLPTLVRPNVSGGTRRISCDLGEGGGRDSTVILVGDRMGILYGQESAWVGPGEAASLIRNLVTVWDVPHDKIVYDAGGGRGLDIEPFLEQHGIVDAIPYRGSKEGGSKFTNKRSKSGWALRQRLDPERPKPAPTLRFDPEVRPSLFEAIDRVERPTHTVQEPFCLPEEKPWWPRLQEEMKALKYHHENKRIALEKKELLVKRIRRSPNVLDALMMMISIGED